MKTIADLWPFLGQRGLRAAQALFTLNGIIWLVFAVITLARLSEYDAANRVVMLVVGILMVGNAAAMLAAGLGLAWRRGIAFLFALAVLSVNILLTFTDQVGPIDLLILLIDLLLLGLLIANHAYLCDSSRPA